MTVEEQLEKVKQSLNITGNHLDNTLMIFLEDVRLYITDAGVKACVVDSELATGCICKGVSDLYINGKLSDYFYQRTAQLASITNKDEVI